MASLWGLVRRELLSHQLASASPRNKLRWVSQPRSSNKGNNLELNVSKGAWETHGSPNKPNVGLFTYKMENSVDDVSHEIVIRGETLHLLISGINASSSYLLWLPLVHFKVGPMVGSMQEKSCMSGI